MSELYCTFWSQKIFRIFLVASQKSLSCASLKPTNFLQEALFYLCSKLTTFQASNMLIIPIPITQIPNARYATGSTSLARFCQNPRRWYQRGLSALGFEPFGIAHPSSCLKCSMIVRRKTSLNGTNMLTINLCRV